MSEIEYRAVIKFFFLKQKTPKKIKSKLDLVYKEASPSYTTVKFWISEFKRSRTSWWNSEQSRYLKNPKDFLRRFITGDETWVHYYTPDTKQQSMQ